MAGLHLGVAIVMGRGRNMANFLSASLIFAMIYIGLLF
tara:strand:- start:929 stop:1042 length:114 start_codon:yes stop_codon:yes gene_type:complete